MAATGVGNDNDLLDYEEDGLEQNGNETTTRSVKMGALGRRIIVVERPKQRPLAVNTAPGC